MSKPYASVKGAGMDVDLGLGLDRRSLLQGWGCSVVLHGVVGAALLMAMKHVAPVVKEPPFRWEVAMVMPPPSPADPTPAPQMESVKAPAARPATSRRVEAPAPEPVVAAPQIVTRAVETRTTPTVVERTAEPVRRTAESHSEPRPVETREPHARSLQAAEVRTSQEQIREAHEAVHLQVAVTESVPVLERHPAVQSVEQPVQASVVEPAAVVRAPTVVEARPEATVVTRAASSASVAEGRAERDESDAAPPPAGASASRESEEADVAQSDPGPSSPPQLAGPALEPPPAPPIEPVPEKVPDLPVVARAEPRTPGRVKADYSWLADSLRRRLAEVRRYPATARLNGWEGKVVIRAVIRADGHLAEVSVHRSSGHEALDQAAIEAIRLVCPLHLPQALGTSAVTIYVPITYSLSG